MKRFNHLFDVKTFPAALLVMLLAVQQLSMVSISWGAEPYSWATPHSTVLPNGDIEWSARPFEFKPGDSIRYIDYKNGSDLNDGLSKAAAWKHHPWDPNAQGNAKECSGIHTYVFKGGVWYRGELEIRESGKSDDPIRLTRDPSWGSGEAVICGSEIVKGWKKGADNPDIPQGDKVWYADLEYAPRSVWMLDEKCSATRIPLARSPNWKVSDWNDLKREWWSFDGPAGWDKSRTKVDGEAMHLCSDVEHVKDKPKEFFENALIWYERCGVASAPYPTHLRHIDTKEGKLGFHGWHRGDRGASGIVMKGCRYFLEDKPQYLDDPEGEFWFDKKETGGRLYIRLPGDVNPDTVRIEAAKRHALIHGTKAEHLDISGLSFRCNGTVWDITSHLYNFSARPHIFNPEMMPGCIHVWGNANDIRIANCNFSNIYIGVHIRAQEKGSSVSGILVEDNDISQADYSGIMVASGNGISGHVHPRGTLGSVNILRNRLFDIGRRPMRYRQGTGSIHVIEPRTAEIAGNVIERACSQGINLVGSKSHMLWGDVPFSRVLIHNNRVWNSLLDTSDYGGIETWQGGPVYVYNNLSHNAQGMWMWQLVQNCETTGFGHAYYLDGSFKNYHFNNIAWGKSGDPKSRYVNCAAFQEIVGYYNTFFNNTVYNYTIGSRRQCPEAGRNKYLANIWSGVSEQVFRHGNPAKITGNQGNALDVGEGSELYALETNAYANNVFFDFAKLGCVEPYFKANGWNVPKEGLLTYKGFKDALEKNKCMAAELGVASSRNPLSDPENGDFRPTTDSGVFQNGAKVFVPWSLYGVVGEWGFYRPGGDPSCVLDEHWYMADYFTDRRDYLKRPTYSLKAVNAEAEDYVDGPLEDWTAGALKFSPAKKQYAVLSNAEMMKPFSFDGMTTITQYKGGSKRPFTIKGEELKNPQIYKGNMLIEVYFKTVSGHAGGVLIEKMKDGIGYSLCIDEQGKASFSVGGEGGLGGVVSEALVNDGKWHHVIAEADRKAGTVVIYIDGKLDATALGLDEAVSLANDGDLFVGGTPEGRFFDGDMDFLRLAQGTLADAQTTIEELYAWEFSGPFLRDFAGRLPAPGKKRDAGALQGGRR